MYTKKGWRDGTGAVWRRAMGWVLLCLACTARADLPEPDVQVATQGLQVVINLPQTRLFLYEDGVLVKSWPVAVGKMLTRTPTGSFEIGSIVRDPSWHVPRSIQEEMRSQGKPVLTVVPPGDDNPLGKVFIRFGDPGLGLGIHGTNVPSSVPGFRSHGCVRMRNEDALELAGMLARGVTVTVTYQSILLSEDADGQLWMTAYRNLYQHDDVSMPLLADTLLAWQRVHGKVLFGRRVDAALQQRRGQPVCLSCRSEVQKVRPALSALHWLSQPLRDETPAEVPVGAVRSRPVS